MNNINIKAEAHYRMQSSIKKIVVADDGSILQFLENGTVIIKELDGITVQFMWGKTPCSVKL